MNVPLLENPTIAMILSKDLKNERIILGEKSEIKNYFVSGCKADFIVDIKRPIGSLIKDFVPKTGFIADIIIDLGKKNYDKLEQLYESDNPLYIFLALKILQEYNKNKKSWFSFTDDLRYPLFEYVLKGQKANKNNPFYGIWLGVHQNPIEIIFEQKNLREVAICENELLSIAIWYMRKIYDRGYYLQECKICGKAFLAKTATIEVLCSKKCKTENVKILKAEFDERAKKLDYEREYKKAYMYWYNRLKNYDKNCDEYKAFNKFCDEAIAMKKQVKSKKIAPENFTNWLNYQKEMVDNLIGDITKNLNKSQKQKYSRGEKLFEQLCAQYAENAKFEEWQSYAQTLIMCYAKGDYDYADFKWLIKLETYLDDPDFALKRVALAAL